MKYICAHCGKEANPTVWIDEDPFKTGGSNEPRPYCMDCVGDLAAKAERELEAKNETKNERI